MVPNLDPPKCGTRGSESPKTNLLFRLGLGVGSRVKARANDCCKFFETSQLFQGSNFNIADLSVSFGRTKYYIHKQFYIGRLSKFTVTVHAGQVVLTRPLPLCGPSSAYPGTPGSVGWGSCGATSTLPWKRKLNCVFGKKNQLYCTHC